MVSQTEIFHKTNHNPIITNNLPYLGGCNQLTSKEMIPVVQHSGPSWQILQPILWIVHSRAPDGSQESMCSYEVGTDPSPGSHTWHSAGRKCRWIYKLQTLQSLTHSPRPHRKKNSEFQPEPQQRILPCSPQYLTWQAGRRFLRPPAMGATDELQSYAEKHLIYKWHYQGKSFAFYITI